MQRVVVYERALPGIGTLFELQTESGAILTVVKHRSDNLALAFREGGDDATVATATLTGAEVVALAGLLTDAGYLSRVGS